MPAKIPVPLRQLLPTVRGRLISREKKLQEGPYALCPRDFTVRRSLDLGIRKIAPDLPSLGAHGVAKLLCVFQTHAAFCCPHVEPDLQLRLRRELLDLTQDDAVVPPHRRREHGKL